MLLKFSNGSYSIDLNRGFDLSRPLRDTSIQCKAFHAPDFNVSPVVSGEFIGSTKLGGPVNFMNLQINPHGNGTHTECYGHISKKKHSINRALKAFHFPARLISVKPQKSRSGDTLIQLKDLKMALGKTSMEKALIIRTLPNGPSKIHKNYSGKNPPYLHHKAAVWLREQGVDHLLLDLPSVDREHDGGKLLAHKAFWDMDAKPRKRATITELIFVPGEIKDGLYLLNLMVLNLDLDVSPSRPLIYPLSEDPNDRV